MRKVTSAFILSLPVTLVNQNKNMRIVWAAQWSTVHTTPSHHRYDDKSGQTVRYCHCDSNVDCIIVLSPLVWSKCIVALGLFRAAMPPQTMHYYGRMQTKLTTIIIINNAMHTKLSNSYAIQISRSNDSPPTAPHSPSPSLSLTLA